MRVAVYAPDRDARYELSRMADETLLRHGIVSQIALYPILEELARDVADECAPYDIILVASARDARIVGSLCRLAPVILIGGLNDGTAAFELGARYFIVAPVYGERLDRAISHCLTDGREKAI